MLYCPPDASMTWEERVSTVGSDDECIVLDGRRQRRRTDI